MVSIVCSKKNYLVNEPFLKKSYIKYLNKSLKDNWISSMGPYVKEFEEKTAELSNRKYALSCSSGTTALQLAYRSFNLKKNDEILVTSFSIISTILPAIEMGLKIKFCDIDDSTYNINKDDFISKISDQTKLLVLTHTYGLSIDLNDILEIAKKKKIHVIEDAAEVQGQHYKNKPCGSFGDISIFSFYSNKQITTGEGGMCLTNNKALYDKMLQMRNLSFGKINRFKHTSIGYNYRLSSIQCALGIKQLDDLGEIIEKRKNIGNQYINFLKSCDELIMPLQQNKYSQNIFWVFPIKLSQKINIKKTKKLRIYLSQNKIQTRDLFYPLPLQPILKKKYNVECYKNSLESFKRGFYIPNSLNLKKNDIEYISKKILNFFK